MAPGSRASKRTYSQSFPEEELAITRSQPSRSVASIRKQSKLAFSQSALQETPRVTTPRPQQRSPSPIPSQESSIVPSESASNASRLVSGKILANRRIYFEVDLSNLEGDFRTRTRNIRSLKSNKISWIYLHGIEIEKRDKHSHWAKHWLCKPCFDEGDHKAFAAASTHSASEHLRKYHKIHAPGTPTSPTTASSIDAYLNHRHPLAEEQWQTAFINWIANNDITFEAAADPTLHAVIL